MISDLRSGRGSAKIPGCRILIRIEFECRILICFTLLRTSNNLFGAIIDTGIWTFLALDNLPLDFSCCLSDFYWEKELPILLLLLINHILLLFLPIILLLIITDIITIFTHYSIINNYSYYYYYYPLFWTLSRNV